MGPERLHGAARQDEREQTLDRNWGPFTALRETGLIGPVALVVVLAIVGIYAGATMARNGEALGGVGVGAVTLVVGGLWLDSELCKGTPATVHECRRCRRETDRWRGPTADDQSLTSLLGQRSAAARTPSATRYDRADPVPPASRVPPADIKPAIRRVDEPRPAPAGDELFETVAATDDRLDDLPPELQADLEERLESMAEALPPEEFAAALSPDEPVVIDDSDPEDTETVFGTSGDDGVADLDFVERVDGGDS